MLGSNGSAPSTKLTRRSGKRDTPTSQTKGDAERQLVSASVHEDGA